MNNAQIAAILDQAQGCLLPLEQASSLPPGAFNEPDWFGEENLHLFQAGWVAVARSAELAEPNEYITTTIGTEPCVVVRKRDGTLAALSNVCPHRSATIVGDRSGSAASLQCSYHQWTFGHGGELKVAPSMDQVEGFDPAGVCLANFAVDEWHGFVVVNVDSNAERLSTAVPSLDALFEEHRITECVSVGKVACPSPWNWKITVENFLESYHHRGVHPVTLDATYPGARSFGTFAGTEPWSGVDHVSVVADSEPFIALAVYPSLLIAINRGLGMFWFRAEPVSADETMLTIEALVLPELADMPDIGAGLIDVVTAINDEDAVINERTAAGLRSTFARPGRVSHLEAAPWHFRRWLITQLSVDRSF